MVTMNVLATLPVGTTIAELNLDTIGMPLQIVAQIIHRQILLLQLLEEMWFKATLIYPNRILRYL